MISQFLLQVILKQTCLLQKDYEGPGTENTLEQDVNYALRHDHPNGNGRYGLQKLCTMTQLPLMTGKQDVRDVSLIDGSRVNSPLKTSIMLYNPIYVQ